MKSRLEFLHVHKVNINQACTNGSLPTETGDILDDDNKCYVYDTGRTGSVQNNKS